MGGVGVDLFRMYTFSLSIAQQDPNSMNRMDHFIDLDLSLLLIAISAHDLSM